MGKRREGRGMGEKRRGGKRREGREWRDWGREGRGKGLEGKGGWGKEPGGEGREEERDWRRREGREGDGREGDGSEGGRDWRGGKKTYSDSCPILLTHPDLFGSFLQRAPFAKTWADCQRLNLHKRSTMEAILRVGPPLPNTCPVNT